MQIGYKIKLFMLEKRKQAKQSFGVGTVGVSVLYSVYNVQSFLYLSEHGVLAIDKFNRTAHFLY